MWRAGGSGRADGGLYVSELCSGLAEEVPDTAARHPVKRLHPGVLQRLHPETFPRCFAGWQNSLAGLAGAKLLSIDGKRQRRTRDGKHHLGALHLVSICTNAPRLALGQVASFQVETEQETPTRSPLFDDYSWRM